MDFLLREEGQGLVEYAIIIVSIAILVLVAVSLFGTQVSVLFSQIVSGFP
jgi:pilus assembly protein Flp/PilA